MALALMGCQQGSALMGCQQGSALMGCQQGPALMGCRSASAQMGCQQGLALRGCRLASALTGCQQGCPKALLLGWLRVQQSVRRAAAGRAWGLQEARGGPGQAAQAAAGASSLPACWA